MNKNAFTGSLLNWSNDKGNAFIKHKVFIRICGEKYLIVAIKKQHHPGNEMVLLFF